MRKRIAAVSALLIISAFLAKAANARPARLGSGITAGPYLMQVTQTSQTVMWETRGKCSSEVLYGTALPLTDSVKMDEPVKIHEITVTGLVPETKYLYQVRSRCGRIMEGHSEVLTFQTAVRHDSAFAYVVMGDNRSFPWRFHRICKLAWAERPDFVINVGDVVTMGNAKYQWHTEFLSPAATLMSRVPTYIAIGNHERDSHWFYDYVSYPPPENYYSFDYGDAHFSIIDSNKDLSPGSEEYQWLEHDLASTTATWKFAAHHHPQYSSDEDDYGDAYHGPSTLGDENARKLIPLYEKYGVDIVWVGHIHDYERTWPLREGKVDQENGVIYIQTGGGGGPLEDFAPTRSWYTAKVKRDFQYCLVNIHGRTLYMNAYDIEGRMYDYLEIEK